MKAKAVVFESKLQVRVQEIEVPEMGRDQVLIDVICSWISTGTESSFLRQERISGEVVYRDGDPSPFPHVPGYQKTGVIRAVGEDVRGLAPGDLVFASWSEVQGMAFPFGGHVSPAVTPAEYVWKLPEDADPQAYAGLVLTQVGYNCGARAPLQKGDTAIVIGDGLVGQWAAQTLLHRGARVVVLGHRESRLNRLPPAVQAIHVRERFVVDLLPAHEPIQVVVDTVGAMGTFRKLLPLMRRNGHFVSAGFLGTSGVIDIQALRPQEITLHCPSGWERKRMDTTLDGIRQGWLQTAPLITHVFSVDQAAACWDLILDKTQPSLGVVLKW